MDIGQVFSYDSSEFAIKRIIVPGGTDEEGVVYPNGRVDASKFVGDGMAKRIQKGRPKKFDYFDVAGILGEPVNVSVESDLTTEDEEKVDEWAEKRTDPAKIKEFMEKYWEPGKAVATDEDW